MPVQLFIYYIKNPLVIISINSGSWGANGCLARDRNWIIGKGGTKRGEGKAGFRGRDMSVAGFCDPCVCLGVFLLL
jgi:hypothetical protein